MANVIPPSIAKKQREQGKEDLEMYHQSREPQYDEAAALGILQHLDKDALQTLLDNDQKLEELISDMQQVKNVSAGKEEILTNNKSVAEYNLSLEPRLVQAKEQLAYSYEEAVKYQKAYEQAKQKLDYQSAQTSLDTTHALLQTEVAKLEEESENMTEQFLQGDMEDTDFVSEYVKKRTETHVFKVKSEKMGELLRDRQRGGGLGNSVPEPAVPSFASSQASVSHRAAPPPPPNYQAYNQGPLPYPVPAATGGGWSAHTPYQPQAVAMPNPSSYYPR